MRDRASQLKIVICAITRRRPELLKQLLASLVAMRRPENALVSFLVVENDQSDLCKNVVFEMRDRFSPASLHYLLESDVGIPIARNSGAAFAAEAGADLLAFIDDDEMADEHWLCALVDAYRTGDALLLGGPVLAIPPSDSLRGIERFMFRLIAKRSERKAERASANAKRGKHNKVTITTGNWIGSLDLFTTHGLRFDEKMRATGGSDAAFFAELKRRKLPVRWVPESIARETVPLARLRPTYQLRRAYGQSASSFRRKLDRNKLHLIVLPITVPLRTVAVVALLLAMPLTQGATFLPAIRSAGWVAGRVAAAFGGKSTLYRETTGY